MERSRTRGLMSAVLVSAGLLAVALLESLAKSLWLAETGLLQSFTTITPVVVFCCFLVALVFVRTSALQRYVVLGVAVLSYCLLQSPADLGSVWSEPLYLAITFYFSFTLSTAGVAAIVAAAVHSTWGLGAPRRLPSRPRAVIEDETTLPLY